MKLKYLRTLCNRELIELCVLIIASTIPFVFSLNSEFVFDDSEAIYKNKDVTSNSFFDAFYSDFWGVDIESNLSHKSYRPLTINTFRLNFKLSGNRFIPYHFKITNLIFHTLCTILIFYTYRGMLAGASLFRKKFTKYKDVDFYSALLFAVHPVHTEAVSGIVGRADILAAITYFASFLHYNYSIINGNTEGKKTWICLMISMKLAFISMLFKENGITILGFSFMYDVVLHWKLFVILVGLRKHFGLKKDFKLFYEIKYFNCVIRLIVIIITIVVSLSIRWLIMGNSVPQFKSIDNPAAFSEDYFTKIATYNYIYFLNILIQIWPQWLCFDWSMGCVPVIKSVTDPRLIFVALFYLYLIMFSLRLFNNKVKKIKRRMLLFAAATLVIPFLPASNIFFTVGFVLAERILYISSAGYCLLIVIGVKNIERISKKIAFSFYLYLIMIYTLRSAQRSFDWQNEYKLFTSGLKVCPLNAKVHYNVAKVADAKDLTQWALAEYREALRLFPDYYQAMNNLANMQRTKNQLQEAETLLKRALKLKDDFAAAWMNLGIVYVGMGRNEQSEKAYLTALQHRKNYPDCYYNLGNLYLEINDTSKAIRTWKKALELNPRHEFAWANYLAILVNQGLMQEALEKVPLALEAVPESGSLHFVAANLYGRLKLHELAEKHFHKCIHLLGDNVEAVHHANFGVLYHQWKKYKLAETQYKLALSIDPNFQNALNNLKSVQQHL